MRIYDIIVLLRSRCPIGTKFDDFVHATAMTDPKNIADASVRDLAQHLLDAEELFLPKTERTLRQLQNPRYRLVLADTELPPGITGIVTDGIVSWHTDGSRPEHLDTLYQRTAP